MHHTVLKKMTLKNAENRFFRKELLFKRSFCIFICTFTVQFAQMFSLRTALRYSNVSLQGFTQWPGFWPG